MKIISALIFVAFVASLFYAPYLAVDNMRKAATAHNAALVSSYIDYPRLRENLRAEINSKLTNRQSGSENGISLGQAVGDVIASAVVGRMIDAIVRPESLALMMQGYYRAPVSAMGKSNNPPSQVRYTELSRGYEDIDLFDVSLSKPANPDSRLVFVFEREGLFTWKLVSIRFP